MNLIFGLFLISNFSLASTQEVSYLTNSNLPMKMQVIINEALSTHCSSTFVFFRESDTAVQENRHNESRTEYIFATNFSATDYFDGQHPVGDWVTVNSRLLNNSELGPDSDTIEVVSVSDANGSCH